MNYCNYCHLREIACKKTANLILFKYGVVSIKLSKTLAKKIQ